ncbi:uncharacterized protein LOC135368927 isoform X2 [Ornithodoros turicata]|uniref:uncharacterized protein LOC135368927 isoform X2 n=1 Tax=Ornithodoros turicata TaxID=34597 RepID=UPI0031398E72
MEFRFPSGYGSTLLIVLLFILGSIYTYYPMSWKGTDEVNLEGEGYLKNTSELDNVLDHRFSPETRFLSAVTNGGLGNQMCSYAITYAMAKLTKRQGIIFPWTYKDLSRYFRITLPVILNETTWKCSGSAGTDWMSEEHYLLHSPCVVLSGYYQSWTFFHHAREDVIREFTFHDSYSWASSRPDQKQCLPDWIPIQANISYLYKKASSEATPQTTANATVTPVDETEKKGRLWERLKEMMRPVFR